MSREAVVRPAGAGDAAAVAAVHETARRAYYGSLGPDVVVEAAPERRAMWDALLADPARATVLCAEAGGRVVGFVSMGPPLHEPAVPGPVLELHALYVLPSAWGTGLGSRLHDAFTTRLTAGPAHLGVLEVWGANRRALDFYAHRGWLLDGRTRPCPDGSAYLGMTLHPPPTRP